LRAYFRIDSKAIPSLNELHRISLFVGTEREISVYRREDHDYDLLHLSNGIWKYYYDLDGLVEQFSTSELYIEYEFLDGTIEQKNFNFTWDPEDLPSLPSNIHSKYFTGEGDVVRLGVKALDAASDVTLSVDSVNRNLTLNFSINDARIEKFRICFGKGVWLEGVLTSYSRVFCSFDSLKDINTDGIPNSLHFTESEVSLWHELTFDDINYISLDGYDSHSNAYEIFDIHEQMSSRTHVIPEYAFK
jgi:hypothetical protein